MKSGDSVFQAWEHYETKTTEYFETLHSGKTKKFAKLLRNVKVQRRLLKLLMKLEIPLRDEIENTYVAKYRKKQKLQQRAVVKEMHQAKNLVAIYIPKP